MPTEQQPSDPVLAPGEVDSVYDAAVGGPGFISSSIGPAWYTSDDDAQRYYTSTGVYSAPFDGPEKIGYETIADADVIKGAAFVPEADGESVTISQPEIESASDEDTLIVSYDAIVDSQLAGTMTVTSEFVQEGTPKTTVVFVPVPSGPLEDARIVWKLVVADALKYMRASNEEGEQDTLDLSSYSSLTLLDTWEGLAATFGDHAYVVDWDSYGTVDWADQGSGALWVGPVIIDGTMSGYGIEIKFPDGVHVIDPSLFGGSDQGVGMSPQSAPKSFYWDGFYWAFYESTGYIKWECSRDGIGWSMSGQDVGCNPGMMALSSRTGFDIFPFGGSILMTYVEKDNGHVHGLFMQIMGDRPYISYDIGAAFDLDPEGSDPPYDTPSAWTPVSGIVATDGFVWIALVSNVGGTGSTFVRVYRSGGALPNLVNFYEEHRIGWGDGVAGNTIVRLVARDNGALTALLATKPTGSGNGLFYVNYDPLVSPYWSKDNSTSPHSIMTLSNSVLESTFSAVRAPDDRVAVAFASSGGGLSQGWISGSMSPSWVGGQSITTATNVEYPAISVDALGRVYAAWKRYETAGDYVRYAIRGESSWSAAQDLYGPDSGGVSSPHLPEVAGPALLVTWIGKNGIQPTARAMTVPMPLGAAGSAAFPWGGEGISPSGSYVGEKGYGVSLSTGQLIYRPTDFSVGARGMPFTLSRLYQTPRYFTTGSTPSPYPPTPIVVSPYPAVGLGWGLDLPWISGTEIYLVGGAKVPYAFNKEGKFQNRAGIPFAAEKAGTAIKVFFSTGVLMYFERFGAIWRLAWINDNSADNAGSENNKFVFTYNSSGSLRSIRDPASRYLILNYQNSRLSSVEYDPDSAVSGDQVTIILYAYGSSGELTSATDRDGNVESYGYESTYDGVGGYGATTKYHLTKIAFREGGYVQFKYATAVQVGSETWTTPVVKTELVGDGRWSVARTLCNGAQLTSVFFCARSMSIGYDMLNGAVLRTRVANGDGSSERRLTDQISSPVRGYRETIVRDSVGFLWGRDITWFNRSGVPTRIEHYLKSATQPTSFENIRFDDWGNPIYRRDAFGYEVFSSFVNTDSQNEFRSSGDLNRTSTGTLFEDRFDLWTTGAWETNNACETYPAPKSVHSCLDATDALFDPPSLSLPSVGNYAKKIFSPTKKTAVWFFTAVRPGEKLSLVLYDGTNARLEILFDQTAVPGNILATDGSGQRDVGDFIASDWIRVGIMAIGASGVYDLYINGNLVTGGPLKCSTCQTSGSTFQLDRVGFQKMTGSVPALINEVLVSDMDPAAPPRIMINNLPVGAIIHVSDPILGIVKTDRVTSTSTKYLDISKGAGSTATIVVREPDGETLFDSPVSLAAQDTRLFAPAARFSPLTRVGSGFGQSVAQALDESCGTSQYCLEGGDKWSYVDDPDAVSGTKVHVSSSWPGPHSHWARKAQGTSGCTTPLLTPTSNQYLVQYVRPLPGRLPAEIMLQYSTACINPEDSWKGAYWGNNLFNYKAGASGTKLQMSGPIRGNGWLQLIVKASDIGLGGQNIQSIGYALAGGAAQWDLSGVGDSNTGGIRVEHLGAYQYVRLYGEDGWTVLASAQADADGVAFLDLYGSSSKISAFPIAGRLRVYTGTGPGSETQYFSPTRYPLWGGDVWSFNQAEPFERNDVEVHIHDRLAGITSWDDGREGVLLDMETRTLTTPMKLVDLSGYGHHATVTGASTFSMGKGSGKALSFDGNGDDVSIPQTEYSVSTSTFSAALWVRPEQLQSTTPINVISWGDPTSTTWAWYIELLPTTSNNYFHVVAHAASSTTSVTLQVNNAVRKSTEWTHLALVYDGHTVVLFINGAPTASSPQEGLTLRNPSAAITIGKKFVGGTTIENYAGLIDELRIYRRPLTEEPVLQLFLLERTPAKKTFIGYDVYGSPILRKTEWVSTLWQDVDWLTESFGYDGYRNLATYVNPAGQTTYLDQTTNPSETYLKETRTTVGSGPQIKHQWTYDAWGRVATTTTPEGYVTDYGYDVVGRITSILYPANTQGAALRPAEYWVYVDSDRRIEYTAPSGWVLKSYYDGLGRVQRTARHFPDNGWEHTDYWYYNFQDRVFKEKDKDSNGVIFTYSYDTFGRLLKEEGPWSNPSRIDIRKFEYSDSLGRVRFKDGEGKVTDTYSDRYGRTTATCQWPASQPGASDDCLTGTSLSFVKMAIERDLSGQPKRWIDAGGNPRRWNYNQLGEVSREWYADGTSVRHSSYIDTTSHTWIDYDCEGTSVISQTYSDGLRRPTTVDYIAGNAEDETYTYDRDSRITTAGNSHFRYSYIYNSWNQVINKEIWYDRDLAQTYTKNVGMTYDEFMRLSDVTYPDGVKILYKYSAAAVPPAQPPSAGSNLDRVLSVKAVWAPGQAEVDLVTSFAYNQRDQPVSEVRKASNANLDVAVGYQYDDYGRLTYHTIGLPAPNSFQWTYAYGKNGDTVQDRGSDITYDGLGRMILADVGGPDRTWTYDNNGNRLTQNNGDTHTYTYNYGAGDRLLDYTWKDSGTPIYKLQYYYDAGGRVTEAREATYCGGACNSYFYAYDEAGRLSKASYGATIPTAVTKGEYKYGPDGELLKSVEQGATKYNFPVSGNVVYTFVPNGETRDYFFANGDLKALRVVNGGTTNYIVYADWQYNIRLITDTSDQKKWEGSYYPFGATLVTTSDISNSFTFAGNNERGNIHLNFFHARWYDSSTGRFLSRDPQERGAWHTQNANLYAYPYNAPNTLVDKSGESPHLLVAGAVGLGAAIGTGLACWWMGHDDCWNKAAIAGVGAFAFVATLGMSSVLFAGFGAAGTVAGFAIAGTASAYVSMTADMALTGHEYTAQEFAGGLVLGAATGALLGGLGAAAARPLSRVATRLGFGPGAPGAGRRIALMGEDMAQVKAAAADLRARGTHVEMMADLPESAFNGYRMNINRYWIRQLMREDVEIWDLGRAPWIEQEGARLRPYYAMELQETYGYWNSWWVQ